MVNYDAGSLTKKLIRLWHLPGRQDARIGKIGYFRVSISSNGYENEADVNGASVRNSKILFTPGPRLKNILKTLEFKKA